MKTLLSEVPVSSNKPFYPSLEFYFAGRCDINCDILNDVFVQCIFMNDISLIRCIRLHAGSKAAKMKSLWAIRDMCSREKHSYCATGKKLPAYELCIKIQFPETFCWWEDLLPKTNQVKLFIGLLLFNCHWHREETLAQLELSGLVAWVYMSWAGSQLPSEQMTSTQSDSQHHTLGFVGVKWFGCP